MLYNGKDLLANIDVFSMTDPKNNEDIDAMLKEVIFELHSINSILDKILEED